MRCRLAVNARFRTFTCIAVLSLLCAGASPIVFKKYRFTPIDVPFAGPLGTSVFGINSSGVMVGNYGDESDNVLGFVRKEGQYTGIPLDFSPYSDLGKINDQGIAVGNFLNEEGTFQPMVYHPDGTLEPIPPFAPGVNTFANGINNQGVIVGYFTEDFFATAHGFIYMNGLYITYDPPGSYYTILLEITNNGRIGGFYFGETGESPGFILNPRGELKLVNYPGTDVAWTEVWGLNDAGDVVGRYRDATGRHGFLMRRGAILPNGVFVQIDYPGAEDTIACDINNKGEIVGTYDFFSRGFLATPK